MYKEIIFILHCFVLSWCFPDPYVFRLTVCFSADPGCSGPCFAFGNKKFGNKGPGCTNRKCQYRHSLTESEKKKAKKGNL